MQPVTNPFTPPEQPMQPVTNPFTPPEQPIPQLTETPPEQPMQPVTNPFTPPEQPMPQLTETPPEQTIQPLNNQVTPPEQPIVNFISKPKNMIPIANKLPNTGIQSINVIKPLENTQPIEKSPNEQKNIPKLKENINKPKDEAKDESIVQKITQIFNKNFKT
jgi:hypothetical protein